ncbi:transposase-like protein [Bradyrhizobium sp. USDA 4472]
MRQKAGPGKASADQVLKDIRRQTRRQYSAEEKIRLVLGGLRGEENISEFVAEKALPPRCITAGRRSFSRPASAAWPATRHELRPPAR